MAQEPSTGRKSAKAPPALRVEHLQGVHLVDSVLWLDAPRRADLCFISHAHLNGPLHHEKVFVSEATAGLAGRALEAKRTLVCPMLRSFALGGLDLSLHPSGHILGAAQLQIRRQQEQLVYTGHFDLSARRLSSAGRILECDHLVIHAQHADELPAREQQEKALCDWCAQELACKRQPVLLCQGLGAAQELAAALAEAGLGCRHLRALAPAFQTYRRLGAEPGQSRTWRAGAECQNVLLASHHLAGGKTLARLRAPSLALVSGSAPRGPALAASRHFRISSHGDATAVMDYARRCQAKRITLLGPAAEQLSARLRQEGIKAWPLPVPVQLNLALNLGAAAD